jgi:hypothetical protein
MKTFCIAFFEFYLSTAYSMNSKKVETADHAGSMVKFAFLVLPLPFNWFLAWLANQKELQA